MKMKTHRIVVALVLFLAAGGMRAAELAGAPTAPSSGRVGVYDSRVLAYAYFWSEPVTKQRNDLVARARAAKSAGDSVQLQELERQIVAGQKRNHLQVFSSAPADEAMAALGPKLPSLQKELGVERLISKWEAKALQEIPAAARVDVTDRLARELFTPSEKQQKIIESVKTTKPLPLWQAKLMLAFGRM